MLPSQPSQSSESRTSMSPTRRRRASAHCLKAIAQLEPSWRREPDSEPPPKAPRDAPIMSSKTSWSRPEPPTLQPTSAAATPPVAGPVVSRQQWFTSTENVATCSPRLSFATLQAGRSPAQTASVPLRWCPTSHTNPPPAASARSPSFGPPEDSDTESPNLDEDKSPPAPRRRSAERGRGCEEREHPVPHWGSSENQRGRSVGRQGAVSCDEERVHDVAPPRRRQSSRSQTPGTPDQRLSLVRRSFVARVKRHSRSTEDHVSWLQGLHSSDSDGV